MGVQLSSSPFASSPAAVWAAAFDAVGERIGPVFARSETREQAQAYLRGLLSPIKRKRGHAPKARHPARKRVILVAGRSLGEDGSHFHA